jgi:hypothetical protein
MEVMVPVHSSPVSTPQEFFSKENTSPALEGPLRKKPGRIMAVIRRGRLLEKGLIINGLGLGLA